MVFSVKCACVLPLLSFKNYGVTTSIIPVGKQHGSDEYTIPHVTNGESIKEISHSFYNSSLIQDGIKEEINANAFSIHISVVDCVTKEHTLKDFQTSEMADIAFIPVEHLVNCAQTIHKKTNGSIPDDLSIEIRDVNNKKVSVEPIVLRIVLTLTNELIHRDNINHTQHIDHKLCFI